ncbi:hypothetical protein EHM92_00155 [bacterium]|nr:MAG: hypothetical protein EHM92_00155 [bacterium]
MSNYSDDVPNDAWDDLEHELEQKLRVALKMATQASAQLSAKDRELAEAKAACGQLAIGASEHGETLEKELAEARKEYENMKGIYGECRAIVDEQNLVVKQKSDESKRLKLQIGDLQGNLKYMTSIANQHRDELSTLKHTIVATIGGVDYEGFPTSEINYLQRLRILLEREAELGKYKDALNKLMCEAKGFISMADPDDHGNTNIAVMNHWIDNAEKLLKES